jgi:resuscitation-promoting factor RpfB
VHFFRAALAPGALLAACALATACGPTGTTKVAEPAAIASSQTAITPTPGPATTSKPAAEPKPDATTSKPIPKPTTTRKVVVELRTIPFKKKTVTDDSLAKGETAIRIRGVNGTRRMTYEVTFVNGVQTAKNLLRQEVAKQPTTQVTAVGTKVEESAPSGCDPNYSGACVPIASDVDCAGGSGNGPAYVRGPVTVVGNDIYDLDRNNDGIGCED